MPRSHRPVPEAGRLNWRVSRLNSAIIRVWPLLLLAGAAVIAYGVYTRVSEHGDVPEAASDIRVPITNAPLEPDRPDLIGEPRIDE
jgi:hypothetical protein